MTPSLVDQMMMAGMSAVQRAERFNPRSPGSVCFGSASHAVMELLLSRGGFRTESQIVFATGRSRSAVSWALIFLRRQRLVRAVPNSSRNSRYLRYAAVPGVRFENGRYVPLDV